MEISGNFKGVFFIMTNWLTEVSFRKFPEITEISRNFKSVFTTFLLPFVSLKFTKLSGIDCKPMHSTVNTAQRRDISETCSQIYL